MRASIYIFTQQYVLIKIILGHESRHRIHLTRRICSISGKCLRAHHRLWPLNQFLSINIVPPMHLGGTMYHLPASIVSDQARHITKYEFLFHACATHVQRTPRPCHNRTVALANGRTQNIQCFRFHSQKKNEQKTNKMKMYCISHGSMAYRSCHAPHATAEQTHTHTTVQTSTQLFKT